MTETTRTTECSAPAGTLYVAFELGSTKWVLAFGTATAQAARVRQIRASDLAAVSRELSAAKERLGLPVEASVRSCYEAGRDGFWLHRWLSGQGVHNVVVDSSSIEVTRRARHAKTDRLDAVRLLQQLLRFARGERKVWSVVHVPTPEAEAARQLTRELATVRTDRVRVRNRLLALLASQGVRCPVKRTFPQVLPALRTGDGRPLPQPLRERLVREWTHLRDIQARLTQLRTAQAEAIAQGAGRVAEVARTLCRLAGIAETSATLYSAELFATRTFQNGRQVGALTGLAPVPYRSDQRVRDQGISKAGRAELRRVSIQVAWLWLRYQRQSELARWYHQRFAAAGGRSRRIGIVAVARKLVVALWRFVAHGVVPAGARLKAQVIA